MFRRQFLPSELMTHLQSPISIYSECKAIPHPVQKKKLAHQGSSETHTQLSKSSCRESHPPLRAKVPSALALTTGSCSAGESV